MGTLLGRRSPFYRLLYLSPKPIGGQPLLIRTSLGPVGPLNVYVGSSFGGFRELFGAIGTLNVRFGAGFGSISPLVCMIGTDFGGIRTTVRRVRPLVRVGELRAQAICQRQGVVSPLTRLVGAPAGVCQRPFERRQQCWHVRPIRPCISRIVSPIVGLIVRLIYRLGLGPCQGD
jgi:hypothetical protein